MSVTKWSPYYYSPNQPDKPTYKASTQNNWNNFIGGTNAQLSAMQYAGLNPLNNGQKTAPSINGNPGLKGVPGGTNWNAAYQTMLNNWKPTYSYSGIGGIGQFKPSQAYTDAMNYTNSLLGQLNSGRTSYSDKVDALMSRIEGRDPFHYDMDKDPLFQQYLNGSMLKGKIAMQDTIGQTSQLTGGYGSTYATAAANGTYNQFITNAYDKVSDYYGMALDAYNQEGQELYNQLGMYQNADATEYSRLANAYSMNLANAQDIYSREYSNYWDTANYNQNAAKFNAEMKYKYDAMNQDNYQSLLSRMVGAQNSTYSSKATNKNGNNTSEEVKPTFTEAQMKSYKDGALKAYNSGGEMGLETFMNSLSSNASDEELMQIYEYAQGYGEYKTPVSMQNWMKSKDTINGGWNIDHNDEITNGDITYTIDQYIDELIKEGYSKSDAEAMAKRFNKVGQSEYLYGSNDAYIEYLMREKGYTRAQAERYVSKLK